MGDRATLYSARRRGVVRGLSALAFVLSAWSAPVRSAAPIGTGEVDLKLISFAPAVGVGDIVEIGLFAVSTTGANVGVSGLDVVLTWDPSRLELRGFANNPAYGWLLSGFLGDTEADGLNDSHEDGDALFQAVGQFSLPAMATPEGFLITTFKFNALQRAERTQVRLERARGMFSRTEVFRFGAVNEDIVGALEPAFVALAQDRKLWALDVSVRAGRVADLLVYGEFAEGETFGVRVQAELTPAPGAQGTVTFTPAPPEDVFQAGDPWGGNGSFTAFDTNTAGGPTGALLFNGSVTDNGTFLSAALAYLGPLTGMPIAVSEDASGEWMVRLNTSAGASLWEPELLTELMPGTVRVVDPHDGDGSGRVDIRDFSEFQGCFTGPVGPVAPAAYDRDPRRHCGVYDDNGDGDVDSEDYVSFFTVQTGPGLQ